MGTEASVAEQVRSVEVVLARFEEVLGREDVAQIARLIVLCDVPPILPRSKSLARIVERECEQIQLAMSKGAPIKSPVGLLRSVVRRETRPPPAINRFVDRECKRMVRVYDRSIVKADPARLAASCASVLAGLKKPANL